MPHIGWPEMLGIMVIVLVVFGPQRLPEIAKQIGKAIREVRKVSGQFQEEIRTGLALDDETFPYMKGPQAQQPTLPKQIAVEPEAPAAETGAQAAEDGVVRYGEVRPPHPPAEADQAP